MIRFIDIRNQGTMYNFAFWDTCINSFCVINGIQAFDTVMDLQDVFSMGKNYSSAYSIERFERLCPEWAFEESPPDNFYNVD